jgi:hypothetical protein
VVIQLGVDAVTPHRALVIRTLMKLRDCRILVVAMVAAWCWHPVRM